MGERMGLKAKPWSKHNQPALQIWVRRGLAYSLGTGGCQMDTSHCRIRRGHLLAPLVNSWLEKWTAPLYLFPWMSVSAPTPSAIGHPCAGTSNTTRAGKEPVPHPLHPRRNGAPLLLKNLLIPLMQMLVGALVSLLQSRFKHKVLDGPCVIFLY